MIEKQYLLREYINKKRTAKDIASEIGLSYTQVTYWVRKHGLQVHPRGGTLRTRDLKGQRFGELKVLTQIKGDGISAVWSCKCKCGNLTNVKAPCLRRGEIKSCGKCLEHYNWKGYGELSGHYYAIVKQGAKKRGLKFALTIQYLWKLFLSQKRKCALSGEELFFARSYGATEQTASLDRIDSRKGYVKGNVQWIHKHIQTMKWNLDEKELFLKIKHIYEWKGLGDYE